MLAKHCGFDKHKVWELTLPQVSLYLKQANKWIKFEVETRGMPFGMFGAVPAPSGGGNSTTGSNSEYTNLETTEDGYSEMTEDDFMLLAQALGGG